jgi:hypothetical protein
MHKLTEWHVVSVLAPNGGRRSLLSEAPRLLHLRSRGTLRCSGSEASCIGAHELTGPVARDRVRVEARVRADLHPLTSAAQRGSDHRTDPHRVLSAREAKQKLHPSDVVRHPRRDWKSGATGGTPLGRPTTARYRALGLPADTRHAKMTRMVMRKAPRRKALRTPLELGSPTTMRQVPGWGAPAPVRTALESREALRAWSAPSRPIRSWWSASSETCLSRHENASWRVRPGPGLASGHPGQGPSWENADG